MDESEWFLLSIAIVRWEKCKGLTGNNGVIVTLIFFFSFFFSIFMTLRAQIGLERWEAIPFTVLWTLSGRNGFSFTLERILQVQKILHWLWRKFAAQWESTLSNLWSKYFCSVTNPKFLCLYDSPHYSDLPCGKIVVAILLIFYEFLKSVRMQNARKLCFWRDL